MTGTAIQCNIRTAMIEKMIRMNFDKLFFKERFLNFKAIIGNLLIISRLTTMIVPYKNHLLINISFTLTMELPKCNASGNEAIRIPDAGIGTPLNP